MISQVCLSPRSGEIGERLRAVDETLPFIDSGFTRGWVWCKACSRGGEGEDGHATEVARTVRLAHTGFLAVCVCRVGLGGGVAERGGLPGLRALCFWRGVCVAGNRKVNEALVQGVETARAVLTTTPQGQAADAQFVKWLMDHQKEAGVFAAVSTLVDQVSDNPAAKMTAQEIAKRAQQAQQQRPVGA